MVLLLQSFPADGCRNKNRAKPNGINTLWKLLFRPFLETVLKTLTRKSMRLAFIIFSC
jgi:hypothetical protein